MFGRAGDSLQCPERSGAVLGMGGRKKRRGDLLREMGDLFSSGIFERGSGYHGKNYFEVEEEGNGPVVGRSREP